MAGDVTVSTTEITEEFLIGELGRVFDDQAEELEKLERETGELREKFREAREVLDRSAAEISEAEAEIEGLPQRLSWAEVRDEDEEKEAVKARYKELSESVEAAREARAEALDTIRHGDPFQVESAALQSAGAKADAVVRDAGAQRARLQEALDEAFRELDEKANRVRQFQRTHSRMREALNG